MDEFLKDACGCSHHPHEEENSCGCGHHHHHEEEITCGCGHHHHHQEESSCGCGHHHHHEVESSCSCGHSHDAEGCGCSCCEGGAGWKKEEILPLAGALILFFSGLLLPVSTVVQMVLYGAAYLLSGWKVLWMAAKNIRKGYIFDEAFLMSLASLGACFIGDFGEGAAVMLFYNIGELFQSYAVNRSRGSISDLMDIRPDTTNLLRDGQVVVVPSESVKVGDLILIKAGEQIPQDGIVVEGNSELDTAALTGESIPQSVTVEEPVLAGCVNLTGTLRVRVTKPFQESTASKILELTEHARGNKAKAEKFITKFARYYTPAVVIVAAIIAVIPPLANLGTWPDFIHRALTFLVISCPCALVISVPMGFFAGIGCASKNGILVKSGNYLEALSQTKIVVFDKTGTLTQGTFHVAEAHPQGCTKAQLLEWAALAEAYSNHPIAQSLREAYGKEVDLARITETSEIAGHGVRAVVEGRIVLAGKARLLTEAGIGLPKTEVSGTAVYVAVDGTYMGHLLIGDTVKPEAQNTIKKLKNLGVRKTVMLTGDHISAAQEVGREAGVDSVQAELLPMDKVRILESLLKEKNSNGTLLFVGDGMNDAPVLARADVGVAMGGIGTDAAIEAADVVIMDDDLSHLPAMIQIARHTRNVVTQNIVFALGVKAIILILGAFGKANMWAAVFADVGVSFLAILNSLRALRFKKEP